MVKYLNNKGIRYGLVFFTYCIVCFAYSQAQDSRTISLARCYLLTEQNYPLIQQQGLIEKALVYSIDNVAKGKLPQLHLSGQVSYQSDVTQIPISLPGISKMDKDQYKLYAEIVQPLTQLRTLNVQKELLRGQTSIEAQKLLVDLYQLKERVNQLYFGILLLDAQLSQTEILKKDILLGIERSQVAIAHGIALKSSIDVLQAELLSLEQRITEQEATRKGYVAMLALFINQAIADNTTFEIPASLHLSTAIKRPELQLFDLQKQTHATQRRLLDRETLPQFNIFIQGGYGKPGLNMLKNNFDLYYVTGLRLNWNISRFYTYRQEKQLLGINQLALDVQKETFLFNTALKMVAEKQELTKLEALIRQDAEIIQLREGILGTAYTQLEYGTITTLDYLRNVHAADQARQQSALHRMQLLLTQYQLNNTVGQ